MELSVIENQVFEAAKELSSLARLEAGDILVVGGSSSEVAGKRLGSASAPEVGEAMVAGLLRALGGSGVFLAAQCCEHLDRALVLPKAAMETHRLVRVNVLPQPKAGGSLATAAYKALERPVVVEAVQAAAGLDIGGTLIGMHLRPVAVPVRLSVAAVGSASLSAARTRPKLVGGVRAVYDEALL